MMSGLGDIYKKYRIIVAATGSVASIKLVELVSLLLDWAEVKIVLTGSAKKFVNMHDLQQLKSKKKLQWFQDQDQWLKWNKRGDPVLHIQLRKWGDALVIAPLSANTLAKLSTGICDNLVTLICRCWNMKKRENKQHQNEEKMTAKSSYQERKLNNPIIICPAMNTMMWEHPITEQQLNKLRIWGYTIVQPVQKVLVCGDQGKGAMSSIDQIIKCTKAELDLMQKQEQIKSKQY